MCRGFRPSIAAVLLLTLAAAVRAQAPPTMLHVDAPPALASTKARIEAIDLSRIGEALARAGLDLPRRIQMLLVDEDHALAERTPDWVVGLASGQTDIVIFPSRVGTYPYDSLESVVRHEIAHLALASRADGRPLPRWFHEGVAVSVDAGFGVGSQLRLLMAVSDRPAVDDVNRLFTSQARSDATSAYLLSAALVDDVRRRQGAQAPGLIAARVAQGIPFPQAFELETGDTPDRAAARVWASYLGWTNWVPTITGGSAMWAIIMALAFMAYAAQVRRRRRRRRQWDEEDRKETAHVIPPAPEPGPRPGLRLGFGLRTRIVRVEAHRPDRAVLEEAAHWLRTGRLVAFPTETVYGLGAHALDRDAIRRLYEAKGRPANDPLIVHIGSMAQLSSIVTTLPESARALASRFWPGPLTIVLPRGPRVPDEVTAGLDTVAVRIPAHPVAHALVTAAAVPIAAPSANLFSRPSPTTAAHVLQDLDGRIDLVIDAGPATLGVESTVVDLSSRPAVVLRPGAVTLDMLREVLPDAVMRGIDPGEDDGAALRSPGLLSRHYSPRAPLVLYEGDPIRIAQHVAHDARAAAESGQIVGVVAADEDRLDVPDDLRVQVRRIGSAADLATIAAGLYAALRDLDAAGVDLILARGFADDRGLGPALTDRLRRAAGRIVQC